MAASGDPNSSMVPRPATGKPARIGPAKVLISLASLSWLAYIGIVLGGQSLYEADSGSNVLLLQLCLFGLAFVCHLGALHVAIGMPASRSLLALIIVPAVVFRLTLLLSDPIEEIDLYRYLWDGAVLDRGISPFRYSPQQVLEASVNDDLATDLRQLVELRDKSPALRAVLGRIHFGELPTIYPPVSQFVFAAADRMTPVDATVPMRMGIVRAWFVAFDLATLFVLLRLLPFVGLPPGWAIAYGWCPLVLKEIANSGHLDSLAILLTITALFLALRCDLLLINERKPRVVFSGLASFALVLAVGAKLYPIVLAPVLFAVFYRQHGWGLATGFVAIAVVLSTLVLLPMLPTGQLDPIKPDSIPLAVTDEPPLPPEEVSFSPKDPSQSLRAFLSRWEMNDFIFLVLIENIRPTAQLPPEDVAWFSFVPESWRSETTHAVQSLLNVNADFVPFLVTRVITSIVLMALISTFAWRAGRSNRPIDYLNGAFLTLAWFWLLLPTGNPWYWTWAVPFLPFTRNRAWFAVSGLAFAYYLRFWLVAHFPNGPVLGSPYNGALFFDYIVTWIEFAPWFAWLAIEAVSPNPWRHTGSKNRQLRHCND